jgi:hypothetical protein
LTLIRNKYKREQGSSLNSVLSALKHYAKGGAILSHKLVITTEQIKELKAAAKAATQHKSHKRRQIQKEGTLTVEEGQQLTALKEFRARSDRKKRKKRVRAEGGKPSQQRCRTCREGGHNTRTYKNSIELVSK